MTRIYLFIMLGLLSALPTFAQKQDKTSWTVRYGIEAGVNGVNANTLNLSDHRGRLGAELGGKVEIFRSARPSHSYMSAGIKLLLLRSKELFGGTQDMEGNFIPYRNKEDAYYLHIPIHGVELYHDNTLSGGTLVAEDYNADLRQIHDIGANAIRSAVFPHAQYLYDRCDEQGLLVWIDMPFHRAPFLGDMSYFATPEFEENGMQQLQEIIAQNINHPSVVMWGIFSQLWMRGDDVTPYLRRLNDTARTMDPSRPTVACSDQDGALNFITDLIVWKQDVGWRRGSTDDVIVWRDLLQKNWSYLKSGVCYGGQGFLGHKSYTTQDEPRSNWLPEEKQTRFHEEYARNLQNDSLFWGVWIESLFDYGSARRPYGVNGSGLVTLNRREYKDAFYLYRAMWNRQVPTLHIVDKRRKLRDGNKQVFRVYSSLGMPLLTAGTDTLVMNEYAPCQYRTDSVALRGVVEVKAAAGNLRDSVTILVGNVLKPKRMQAPRRTTGPQTTN